MESCAQSLHEPSDHGPVLLACQRMEAVLPSRIRGPVDGRRVLVRVSRGQRLGLADKARLGKVAVKREGGGEPEVPHDGKRKTIGQ